MQNVNFDSTTAMQLFLSRQTRSTLNNLGRSYSRFVEMNGLNDLQRKEIAKQVAIYNEEHAPYHIIDATGQGNFMLIAAVDEPEGMHLRPLDFTTNAEYMSVDVMTDFCKTVVRFYDFCDDLAVSANEFRAHNLNDKLIPASIRQVA